MLTIRPFTGMVLRRVPDTPVFFLGHISDPHLTSLAGARWRDLLNKRILGYLSWRGKRRHVYRREVLDRVVADMRSYAVDHVAVTGDLTHIGLPHECEDALGWLRSLGSTRDVSVVLGNHDRYIDADWAPTVGRWQDYFVGDEGVVETPWVRVRDAVALVGVNTAVPTGPFFATGRVGESQRSRLLAELANLGAQGKFRVVLIHHSPLHDAHIWRKRLVDGKAVLDVIRQAGAELMIHGHEHAEAFDVIDTDTGDCVVSAVPSGSAERERGSGWNGYRVSRVDGQWHLQIERRRYDLASRSLIAASTDRHRYSTARSSH